MMDTDKQIFVCVNCHEKDKKVTKCKIGFMQHTRIYPLGNTDTECFVCGARKIQVARCNRYKYQARVNKFLKED